MPAVDPVGEDAGPVAPPCSHPHENVHTNHDGGGPPSRVVTVCDPDLGTFGVRVACDARVDDLVDAIGQLHEIANALHTVDVYVAGEEDPLACGSLVAATMADASADVLFMLRRVWSDRLFLMAFFHENDADNWADWHKTNWGSDAPLSEWAGATADAGGNLAKLDLSYNFVYAGLPANLGGCTHLQTLDLSHNKKITCLPATLGGCVSLQTLICVGCEKLETLPASAFQLTNLQSLQLGGSGISTVSDSISKLTNLRALGLPATGISSMPDTIGQLANLEDLCFGSCSKLQSLPATLGGCTSLKELNLVNCSSLQNKSAIKDLMKAKVPGCAVLPA